MHDPAVASRKEYIGKKVEAGFKCNQIAGKSQGGKGKQTMVAVIVDNI